MFFFKFLCVNQQLKWLQNVEVNWISFDRPNTFSIIFWKTLAKPILECVKYIGKNLKILKTS